MCMKVLGMLVTYVITRQLGKGILKFILNHSRQHEGKSNNVIFVILNIKRSLI